MRSIAAFRIISMFALASVLLASGAFAQTPTTIHDFNTAAGDVGVPVRYGIAVQGRDGVLYGAANAGGGFSVGGIYAINQAGAESIFYSFPHNFIGCQDGLSLGSDGNFYGACNAGGANGYGILYKLDPSGAYTLLHTFSASGGDGGNPQSPPTQANDGNLYGTTSTGGANGVGAIYKLTQAGVLTILYSFKNTTDGTNPNAALVQGTDGNLYGSTADHGANGYGVIFKVSTKGKLKVLHSFAGADGSVPVAALTQGSDGNFYACTFQGGTNNDGVVFKMSASGKYTLLHNFDTPSDGSYCFAAMLQATDGNFYGTTNNYGSLQDTIYKVTPKGVFSTVYQFDGTSSSVGFGAANALVQSTDGLLYGATSFSATGVPRNGTIYTLNIGAHTFARLTAQSGIVGASISIFGQGFDSSSVVAFGGVQAPGVVLQGTTYITVPVPTGALTGSVTITTGSNTLTSSQPFKVTPTIKTFAPPQGPVGTAVVISGSGLTQTTKVTFGGVAATVFTVNSDAQITATVPTGAKTGKIAVTTKGGSVTTKTKFTVQ